MSAPGQKKHREVESEQPAVGFQIAPMIDVVFVIMLFFMVMVGSVKVERELKSQLPGLAPPNADAPKEMPDEIIVGVEETGSVTLNEEEFDGPTDKKLPNFTSTLMRLKQEADNRNAKVIVTIQAEEQATYERVIDVLNALAVAKVANVTFTVGSDVGF
ncbi:MAG: biopolymer transporter ExbD [Prosthecobacter sp.]|nr:biopolymer transporter ExbD [Prosthecobacter sp.]HBJ84256.1 biopolymer transporter ExbD [Verrucomicrobiales bacterium]